jgi:hypothetical protein
MDDHASSVGHALHVDFRYPFERRELGGQQVTSGVRVAQAIAKDTIQVVRPVERQEPITARPPPPERIQVRFGSGLLKPPDHSLTKIVADTSLVRQHERAILPRQLRLEQ